MLLREIYIPCSNLNVSRDFYCRIFSDSIRYEEEGLLSLYSGMTLLTETKWTELFGIGKEMREKAVLGINVVFETTGFDNFLHQLKLSRDYETIVYKPLRTIGEDFRFLFWIQI
ncbi:MAG: hypothetical protein KBS81_09590 [Spirochaetales bacterium]|nr:hypothetical protein [Candidatus Physcosoma equi]